MGSRTQSHKLSGGLYVSGRPDTLSKDRTPTMASRAVPYTGGDVKKSGELGKMFDINQAQFQAQSQAHSLPATPKLPSRPTSTSQPNSGSARSGPNSGQLPRLSNSGSMNRKSSGPLPLQPTGLITSGPLSSSAGRRSGQLDPSGHPIGVSATKPAYGSAVTSLGSEGLVYGLKVSKVAMWVFGILVLMGLLVGAFLMVAVKKPVIFVAVAAVLVPIGIGVVWNYAMGKRAILGFVKNFPDTELRGAVDGQFVKITGVVTCGSIPLESSFQRVSRHAEKYVADFYVSDFHSGLRALVKTGYGAKVAPLVETSTVVDITKEKKDLSPNFLRWLADRSLSSDDRVMRLKEGYVKEGSTVSVMGVVRRHENILMIVPPSDPISTACQWSLCLLPMFVEGLILHCDDTHNSEVIPV